MEIAGPFIHKCNIVLGALVAILTYFLGKHWFLFASFLALNVIDWLTGWIKARLSGKIASEKGYKGILKKFGYWIMICLSFGMGAMFEHIGDTIGVNLQVTELLGWFVLASLIINEIRSIIENFVEMGYNVPIILRKGLEVAEKALNEEHVDGILHIDTSDPTKDLWKFVAETPLNEIAEKNQIVLNVKTDGIPEECESHEKHSL